METNGYSEQPTYEYDTQDFIQPVDAVELVRIGRSPEHGCSGSGTEAKCHMKHGNSLNNVQSENSQKTGNKDSQQLPFSFVRVRYDELQFCECCGQGTFGSVYRALWLTQGGKEVAVKKINNMDKEAHILNLLSHRNIVQFYGACADPPNFCIVTEYAPYGSLFDFLTREESNRLEYNQLLSWARDIALGMNYLHEEAPLTIIHRDLKSKNVVICEDFVLKICDFGASRFFGDTVVMTITGTYPWMAPELIQGLPTSELCDVYSFGVVLWELLTREIPFKGLQGFQVAWAVVEREERPTIPTSCPQRFSDLINRCWSSDVTKRPSFYDIIGEFNSMLNNDKLMESTNSFIQSKDTWAEEMQAKIEEMKKQEKEFGAKEEELARKAEKLKLWEERLKEEMKTQTLVAKVRHHRKAENLQFNITGKGKGAIDSVKDALNHVMRKSSFGKAESHSSGFPSFFPESEDDDLTSFSNGNWPSIQNDSVAKNQNTLGSTAFGSKLRPRLSRGSPPLSSQTEEPFIDSGIKFEKSEINNDVNIFSKSPFGDSVFENRKSPKFESTPGNFPGNKVQKQVSSSSEEFSFEGSKMSRSTTETSGGITKEPEVQTWENAKGDAKVSKSNETFEYEPGRNEKPGTHPSQPSLRKLKTHNSSPNLLSQMNNGKKHSNSLSDFSAATAPRSPSASDIVLALNSLMTKSEFQSLGENFACDLSDALKRVYASKQSSNKPQSQSNLENGLDFKRSLKPRLSLKQDFDDFGNDGKLTNEGINFSVAESKNFSKLNSSLFDQKPNESLFDSSKSNSFAESNGFSRLSKSFQKKESSETKSKNRKSSLKMSTSSSSSKDHRKETTVEESSKSSSKSSRRSSKSSSISTSPPLGLPEIQKQTSDWSGMIKPSTKDKYVQITPQKFDKTDDEQQSFQPKVRQNRSTQTESNLFSEANLNSNNISKPKVKTAAKLLPPTPDSDSKTELAKRINRSVDKTYRESNAKSSFEDNADDSSVNKDSDKPKSTFDSPFYYHGSLRKRRLLPNPNRMYNNTSASSTDSEFNRNSNLRTSLPNSLSSLQSHKKATLNTPHNWKRSMSTPEIRAWKNTVKWLEEDNLDSYKPTGEPPLNTKENIDVTIKPVDKPQRHHSNLSADLSPACLPPPPHSVDSGCCADKRCSRCITPLHGVSSVHIKNDANKDEDKSNKLIIQATSSVNHPSLTISKSSDNSSSTKSSARNRLKSDSSLTLCPENNVLASNQEHPSTKETSKHHTVSGKSIKISKQSVNHTFSKDNHVSSHNTSDDHSGLLNSKLSASMQRNRLSDKPAKLSTKDTNLSCNSASQTSLDSAGFPCKFSSEIKVLKSKKPRKYLTKQAFNDLDNHVINNESASTPRQISPSPICDSNNESDIFETEDFTYIIRPKGRQLRAQGI